MDFIFGPLNVFDVETFQRKMKMPSRASFTYFLGHFVVSPVFMLPMIVIGRYGFELNSADMVNRGQPRLIMITNMTKNT